MPVAQARNDAAHQIFAPQQRIQVHGRPRYAHGLQLPADAILQVREQIGLEPIFSVRVRHGVFQQAIHMENGGKRVLQLFQHVPEVDQRLFQSAGRGHARLRLARHFGGLEVRFIGDGQDGDGAEATVSTEVFPPLFIDEPRHRVGKIPLFRWRIGPVRTADGIHLEHPAASQEFHGVVEPAAYQGKIALCGAGRILAAYFPTRQKRAVLVQDHAGLNERGIGQQVRQVFAFAAVVGKFQHRKHPAGRQRPALAG